MACCCCSKEEITRLFFFFFFQAEDGIRDADVTGVQTCALPIYGVDVEVLDRVGVPAIHDAVRQRALVVIDEIGRMEMTSATFRQAVEAALASGVPVLGTILRPAHPWADAIKRHAAVRLIEVTPANRETVPEQLADLVARQAAAR